MAKSKQQSSSFDPNNLDIVFSELARQVKTKFQKVRDEVTAGEREMGKLSEQHYRLTGKSLIQDNGVAEVVRGPKSGSKTKGRRTRHPSPTIEWLEKTLSKKGMTVKQLQEAAAGENLSGLKIAAMLNGSKGKFKAEQGKKEEGVKGKPPMVWGVK